MSSERIEQTAASVGNRAPPHGGEASGGALSSASDDDGGGFRDVRAAVLEEEMTEQRFSVPAAPTKTAAIKRTSQRAKRAIQQSAMREQLQ